MKTPKAPTPAAKSKLNTPRSGFINKGSDSVKKMKFRMLKSEVAKSINSSPKIGKSVISEKLIGNFDNGKEGKSPFNNSGKKKSPQKRKASVESEAVKSNIVKAESTPITEQYLNKNSKSKTKNVAEESTPIGKKQINNPKLSPSPKPKISSNHPVENKAKQQQGLPSKKNNKKSKNTDELVDKVTLTNAVESLIKYIDDNSKERNELLGPNISLLLQIDYIKPPHALRSRLLVPHSLVYENSDICLIIADKGKKGEEQEDLVDEMKQRLKKCGINNITEILSWKKALHEHTQYEQKKKLMNRFDFFLIESRLAKIRAGLTDRFVPNKWPIAVNLDNDSKLKDNIETALRKIPISFKGIGLTKALQFGHYKMTTQQLVENLEAITKALCDKALFFGGRDNIRSLHIKTRRSIAFPLFVSTISSNLVKNPPKKIKVEDEGIEGELTTYPDRLVKVFKDGTVKTKKIKSDEDITSKKQTKKIKKETDLKKAESDDEEEMIESDVDEEEEDDSGDEEISEDEDVDDEEVDAEEEDDDDVEDEEDDDEEGDDDDDDDDDEGDEEDMSSEEEEELKAKLNRLLVKNKMPNEKGKKRKQNSDSDDEAELAFLKELRKQQDEIEEQGKKQFKAQAMGKKFIPKNKKKKPDEQESNNFTSKKVTIGKGQGFSKKNQQQSNMKANNLKKNEANTSLSKNARRRLNKKNKQNKNANSSPTFAKQKSK